MFVIWIGSGVTNNMYISKTNSVSTLFAVFIGFVRGQEGLCKIYPHGCCKGTKWDPQKGKCEECNPGYYWQNCSRICPYPHFGKNCRQTCTCGKEACNFMTGCTVGDEYPKPTTKYSNNTDYTTTTHSAINTTYIDGVSDTKYTKGTSNTKGNNNINGSRSIKKSSNIKYTLLIVGISVLCVVFMAYTVVLVVDKHRKKTMNECIEQFNQG